MSDPLSDPLREAARRQPDAPALDDGGRVWTYAELDAAVGRMAGRLGSLGAAPGATVALVAHPSALSVQAFHAIPRTGAVLAPLNPRLGPAAMERAVDEVAPDVILSTEEDIPALELDPAWVTPVDDLPKATAPNEAAPDPAPTGVSPERPFATLFTSGTSGDAKTVPIHKKALNAHGRAASVRLDLAKEDRWYASLSMAHIGGLALVYRSAQLGCKLIVRGAFSTKVLAELIDRGDLTHASLVPTMLRQLLGERGGLPVPPTLKCLLVGGAAAGKSLIETAVRQGYPIALTYGATEACSQVATAPPELVRRKPDTVGAPLDGIELRLRESGEICIRGATVAPTVVAGGGWFATGDLAEFDDDGHLRLTGRLGDRIISGGVNVDPLSVETVMGELSGVAAVAVVGVPDDQWGEVVAALVVPGPDARPDPAALISAARARLAGAEIPRWIEIADALPLNTNGKVDRGQIRERLTRGYLPAAPQPWGKADSVREEKEVREE